MGAIEKCCGRAPVPKSVQVSEDAVEAWFTCKICNRSSERVEGAYADFGTAQALWDLAVRK